MSKRYGRHNTSLTAFNAPDLRIRFTSIDDNADRNYTLMLGTSISQKSTNNCRTFYIVTHKYIDTPSFPIKDPCCHTLDDI